MFAGGQALLSPDASQVGIVGAPIAVISLHPALRQLLGISSLRSGTAILDGSRKRGLFRVSPTVPRLFSCDRHVLYSHNVCTMKRGREAHDDEAGPSSGARRRTEQGALRERSYWCFACCFQRFIIPCTASTRLMTILSPSARRRAFSAGGSTTRYRRCCAAAARASCHVY